MSLEFVTNHAQLTRYANDFLNFNEKTNVANADRFIIEDSADSGRKKYVQASNVTKESSFNDGTAFVIYKFDLGGWDCDTVASIAIVMPGSVTDDMVLWARATIIRDDGHERWMLNADNVGQIHLLSATPTLIYFNRITGGVLDNVNYNNTLVNRGYAFICVEV